MRSLAIWLNERAVPTVTGAGVADHHPARGCSTNPRYAGLRVHRGQVVGPAMWEPIISEDEHRRVLAKFAEKRSAVDAHPAALPAVRDAAVRQVREPAVLQRPARAAAATCACPGPTTAAAAADRVRRPVERLVADAVLYRLDTPELADTLAGRSSSDERTQELSPALDDAQERLDELAGLRRRGITMREWMTAKKPMTQRLDTSSDTRADHQDRRPGRTGRQR